MGCLKMSCKITLFACLISASVLLVSCDDNSKKTNIDHYIKTTKEKIEKIASAKQKKAEQEKKKVTPTDQPKINLGTKKPAKISRNPFITGPEKQAKGEFLSKFFSGTPKLIGIMTEKNKKWAIIRASNGKLFIVTQGSKMGNTTARVTKIEKNEVTIITSDGDETKTYTLKLQEP